MLTKEQRQATNKRILQVTKRYPFTKASLHSQQYAAAVVAEVIEPLFEQMVGADADVLKQAAEMLDARAEVEELDELIADKQALLRTLHILVQEN